MLAFRHPLQLTKSHKKKTSKIKILNVLKR
ncbi:hypothetical protein T303_01740 [Streptococcus thermophilus ASCC 1275]|nr:hypothetical protein T303_01740 [Streptococcus thermophilus ASCC 1275]